ncbi:hypothetical protein [Nocardia bovistercoris]|uniref:Uncharacterized protein n=1 Tax=Nocardia bovistercoris TaxID=2785916 RepID=A0A931I4P8_9NOCA|nr:hypothetical protein [Nocardia bovistercoris]MBH0774824.1 hypothetical protein [Nocardia bovistercoris]
MLVIMANPEQIGVPTMVDATYRPATPAASTAASIATERIGPWRRDYPARY